MPLAINTLDGVVCRLSIFLKYCWGISCLHHTGSLYPSKALSTITAGHTPVTSASTIHYEEDEVQTHPQ